MGLRINSNIPSLIALRNLSASDARRQVALEHLSTGLRINRASEDPAGIAISESIRSGIRSLQQAKQNNNTSDEMLTTADAALSEVASILIDMQSSIIFSMSGVATNEEIAAEQSAIDGGLAAIDRIASTTRFGDVPLLDGQAGFDVQNVSASIRSVRPNEAKLNPVSNTTGYSIAVTTAAEQGTLPILTGVAGGDATLQVTGPRGSVTLQFSNGATVADVDTAINDTRSVTGVFTSGGAVFSEAFGSEAFVRLAQTGGAGTVNGIAPGAIVQDSGVDAVATFDTAAVTARGNVFALNSNTFRGTLELQPGAAIGTYTWDIQRSGMLLQIGPRNAAPDQMTVGIPDLATTALGASAITIGGETLEGFLATLETGAANSLESNPQNAVRIVQRALDQVNALRSKLGALTSQVIEPANRTHEIAIENLQAADSDLRDADMALEMAAQIKEQILFESGIAVLGQANLIPQAVLRLLQA